MPDYTPTTEEVRAAALTDYREEEITPQQFDRWLAEVKAQERRAERERIIALLEANVGHSMDRYRYWSEVFELIKGESK